MLLLDYHMAHTLLTLSYNILFSRPFHFFQYHFLHRILSVLFLFYLLVYKMLLERSYSCSISLLEYLSKSFFLLALYIPLSYQLYLKLLVLLHAQLYQSHLLRSLLSYLLNNLWLHSISAVCNC